MPETLLENKTFDELQIGDSATFEKSICEKDLILFAMSCGDFNPVHFDEAYAQSTKYGERIVHGMLLGAFVSAMIANQLPGPGSVYVSQSLNFKRPIKLGDSITIILTVIEKQEKGNRVILECVIKNQLRKECVNGTAEVIAPTQKLKISAYKPAVTNKLEASFSD